MGKNFHQVKTTLLVTAVFFANFFVDRLTKELAVARLKGREPLRFLGNTIVLSYTENTGAFLGLGDTWNMALKYAVFVIIPILVCGAALVYALFFERAMARAAILSCVIGGGAGNIVDRICNDFRVIDFMNFGIHTLRTGVLNVADISVTFGGIALLLCECMAARGKTKKPGGTGG